MNNNDIHSARLQACESANAALARTPIALTIAGSDSGGGAGIQADLKTFSALGVYGASVITAITAQNTRRVSAVHDIPADIVAAQIDAVFDDIDVIAVKVGMLSSTPLIETVAHALSNQAIPFVLDPVMVAKSGNVLLETGAISTLRNVLLPHAYLLTPNLPEAAQLLQTQPAANEEQVLAQGRKLLDLGPHAVLMKGGHADGEHCVDMLLTQDGESIRLSAPRVPTKNTHGTGCTLSASVAAGLAKNKDLEQAVRDGHDYLHNAIVAADRLHIGSGHGPVHHFHRDWD